MNTITFYLVKKTSNASCTHVYDDVNDNLVPVNGGIVNIAKPSETGYEQLISNSGVVVGTSYLISTTDDKGNTVDLTFTMNIIPNVNPAISGANVTTFTITADGLDRTAYIDLNVLLNPILVSNHRFSFRLFGYYSDNLLTAYNPDGLIIVLSDNEPIVDTLVNNILIFPDLLEPNYIYIVNGHNQPTCGFAHSDTDTSTYNRDCRIKIPTSGIITSTTINTTALAICVKSYSIVDVMTDNDLSFTKTSCNTISVTNSSRDFRYFDIFVLTNGEFVLYLEANEIAANTTDVYTLPNDGIYKFEYGRLGLNYIFTIDCIARTCMKTYLDLLIHCNTETNCDCNECEEKDYYNFNAFFTLYNTYLMLVAQIEYFNTPMTTIDEAMLAELNEVDLIVARFKDYCNTCDEPCNDC